MTKSNWTGWGAIFSVLVATVVLSSCSISAPTGTSGPSTDSTAGSAPAVTPSDSVPSTSTSTPRIGQPIGLTCQDLLSVQDLYAFNPNFSFSEGAAPVSGSLGEKIVNEQGISCQYLNLSSGETIVISVAKLSSPEIADHVIDIGNSSSPTVALGSFPNKGAFFSSTDGVGTVNLFSNQYWVSATSRWFTQPEDAVRFLEAPLMKLG